ncbi:MAG: hypothetical protein QMD04_06875 [Anaerolineales bacterium]|nr:hypothetical protein [Anaerolineales bacterium]
MAFNVPRYIVWSTDNIDPSDPFQRRWLLKQILTHGRAEDIRALDLQEVKRELDSLDLPPNLYNLWKQFLESEYAR